MEERASRPSSRAGTPGLHQQVSKTSTAIHVSLPASTRSTSAGTAPTKSAEPTSTTAEATSAPPSAAVAAKQEPPEQEPSQWSKQYYQNNNDKKKDSTHRDS